LSLYLPWGTSRLPQQVGWPASWKWKRKIGGNWYLPNACIVGDASLFLWNSLWNIDYYPIYRWENWESSSKSCTESIEWISLYFFLKKEKSRFLKIIFFHYLLVAICAEMKLCLLFWHQTI
jgi:hypothetical protein